MIRVAVIGLGIGRKHVQLYRDHPLAVLAAVVDTNPDVAGREAKKLGVPAYTSLDELLDAESIDAASVCTPPAAHAEQVEKLLGKGVHVLLEKPMASSLADAQRIVAAGEKADARLMIGQKKRFVPAYAFLKAQFAGAFGQPMWANAKYALGRVDKPWFWDEADGGGPIVENAIHIFDLMRYLLGEVTSVYAEGGNLFRPDQAHQIDAAVVALRFASGAVASVACGYGSEWGFADERISIATSKVVCEAQSDRFDGVPALRYIHRDRPNEPQMPELDTRTDFELEIDAFLRAIDADTPPPVTAGDAARSVAVALAVKRSVRECRAVKLME